MSWRMNNAPSSLPSNDPALPATSNKSYDELIREYIRAARERLEAARGVPSAITTGPQTPPVDDTSEATYAPLTALPSPSAQWPLTDSINGGDVVAAPADATRKPSIIQETPEPIMVDASAPIINFNDRPVDVVATAAPQFAPHAAAPLAPAPQSPKRQHRRGASAGYTQGNGITAIQEGVISHASTPTRLPTTPGLNAVGAGTNGSPGSKDVKSNNHENNPQNPFRDGDERGGLVREASVGRSHRPVLTDIKSRNSSERRSQEQQARSLEIERPAPEPETTMPERDEPSIPIPLISVPQPVSSVFDDPVELQVESDFPPHTPPKPGFAASESGFRPGTADSGQSSASSFRFGNLPASQRTSTLSERVGSRRPPRLNLEAVKEAEARGSLTSLPDLIQRALRLASNLERGKTSSRFGTDWLVGENAEKSPFGRRASSFPLHSGPSTPLGGSPPREKGSDSSAALRKSALRHSQAPPVYSGGEPVAQKPRRKCCGMSLYLFLFLLILIIVLMVAAVLIPIFLIVLPDARHRSPCANGGHSILSSTNTLQCLCINGYTGATCTRDDNTGCATTTLAGIANTTVGAALPALLERASVDFAITLNTTAILGLFSATNLTCAAEVALVTFNGLVSRDVALATPHDAYSYINLFPDVLVAPPQPPAPTTAPALDDWDLDFDNLRRFANTATSDGIIFATSTIAPIPTSTSSSSATSSSPATASSASAAGFDPTATTTLNLARTAVLYILQRSHALENAQTAHERLAAYFADPTAAGMDPSALGLGGGWSVNLVAGTVQGDGTTVGGS